MKVVIAGTNTAKLVIYPIAPGPIPGSKLTNWVICMLADKRARARAKERGVTREGLSVFVSGAAQTTRTSPTRRARGPPVIRM